MKLHLVAPSAVLAVFMTLANMGEFFSGDLFAQKSHDLDSTAQKDIAIIASDPTADLETETWALSHPLMLANMEDETLPDGLHDTCAFEKTYKVRRGDTLMALLVRADIDRKQAYEAIDALKSRFDPRRIRAGQELTISFQDTSEGRQFVGMSFEPSYTQSIRVSRVGANDFKAEEVTRDFRTRQVAAAATIRSSLFESGSEAGVPISVMSKLIRLFSWEIDFQRDIHAGDRFEILFETAVADDNESIVRNGEINYAMLEVNGKQRRVYRFVDRNGIEGFYDEEGASIRRGLLRTPIDGARISSGYGMRIHPVLGYSKMHKGVDFAAVTGTPIYAAGDGVLERYGRFSSYGNYVRIRHNGHISTAYAHLSRFAKGLKRGDTVSQRQLIGYVGTTGRSTGPHLHYEVLVDGKQVNPMSVDLPTEKVLARSDMPAFRQTIQRHQEQWAALSRENTRMAQAHTASPAEGNVIVP